MEVIIVWTQFFLLAGLITIAGYHLSKSVDKIASHTGLGRNLAGMILLGIITSLPELMTGISSVTFADNPNLAIGDIFGSCTFNLLIVFVLDILCREGSIYNKATQGHIVTGVFGTILIAFAGFCMVIANLFDLPEVLGVGIFSWVLPVLYIGSMKVIYEFEKNILVPETVDQTESIKKEVIIFFISAATIIAAGAALPFVGEKIMEVMGWKSAFVGTIFIALATSLPELAVTLSSLKIKAYDLAFSNLLGSNLFNMIMLMLDDFAYRKGSLLAAADGGHVATVFTALMMTGLVLLALIYPPQKKVLKIASFTSFFIVLLYVLNGFVVFNS